MELGLLIEWFQSALLVLYSVTLGLLLVFSLHRHVMVRLYFKNRRNRPAPAGRFEDLPSVTVQLPVYNEFYVVERLIRSVAEFDYPRDRLEIQVLDDSTDETTEVAMRCVAELKEAGHNIACLHRTNRTGYKAGALAEGLRVASGEFVAVFDADFLPPREFLKKTIHFFTDEGVGLVQARWDHLNRDYSLLTQVQAIFLDGHFMMEHGARSRSGLFFNFNGTAGIWRRQCIDDAGGWENDTLTEDLDLSYRAQLAGWRFLFLDDVAAPAELPVEMNAWKTQQFRWSKGSTQTARKLVGRVLRASLPWRVKLEALIHLSGNFAYLLMAMLAALIFPAVLARLDLGWIRIVFVDLPLFVSATGAVSRFYIYSQKELYPDWTSRIKYMPCVLAAGMGISFNNARAVLEALAGHQTEFTRTPKYQVVDRRDTWRGKRYAVHKNVLSVVELAVGLYFLWVIGYALGHRIYFPVPFLALFSLGFFYVGWMSLFQGRFQRLRAAFSRTEAPAAD